MADGVLDTLSRRVAARVSRRASLLALGGTALLAAADPPRLAATKGKKKGKKRCPKIDRCPRKACCVCDGAEQRCVLIPH
ncbi:MAG: hypothetical protein ACRDJC_11990, partial [Thermomicrobiales bacterium]